MKRLLCFLFMSKFYREDVLFVFCALDAGDEPKEEVHDSGGGDMGEEEPSEPLLHFDVLDDL